VQRVTVISDCYCDIENCKNGVEVPAQPHVIAIDGATYELDLSRPNYERLVLPLLDALELYGRRVQAGSTKEPADHRRRGPVPERDAGGGYLCPHPDCLSQPGYRKLRSLFQHTKSHRTDYYAKIVEEFSTLPSAQRQCPFCAKNDFFALSGKNSHIRQEHPNEVAEYQATQPKPARRRGTK
jgi:hypothetical protein